MRFFTFQIIILINTCLATFAQTVVIKGYVTDQLTNNPIEGASVTIKSRATFLTYAYTNHNGYYQLSVNANTHPNITIEISSLGYTNFIETLSISYTTVIERNILLTEKTEHLSTVVIKSKDKLEIERDTISFRLSAFKNGTEKNVEDLLKNLPGIEIDSEGNIQALGKPIQKILIEGDDLANNNYKIISKNLDANLLKSVEIINHYEENPVLKQFLESENVVLNLKLKDDKKSILFGKTDAGLGNNNRHIGDVNLGLINPRFKFLNLGFLNNTGRIAENQFNNFNYNAIGFNNFNNSYTIFQNPVVTINSNDIDIEDKYYTENQSYSNSFLLNKSINKKTKLKNTSFIYKDAFNKAYEQNNRYIINPPIIFKEKNDLNSNDLNIGNNLNININPSENSNLTFNSNFKLDNTKYKNKLYINSDSLVQQLKNHEKLFDSNAQFSKKIRSGALIIDGYFGSNQLTQSFKIQPNKYLDANPITNNVLFAKYNNSINYSGIESTLVYKTGNVLHSYKIGLSNLKESIDANVFNTLKIDSLSGNNTANTIKTHAQFKLELPIVKQLALNTDFDGILNFYNNSNLYNTFFLPNLTIYLNLKKTKTGSYNLGFERVSKIERLNKYLDYYVVKSYRSMAFGAEEINPIKRNRLFASHTYSNIKKRIFFNTSLSYSQHENDFTVESFLDINSIISRKIYTEKQHLFLFNTNLITYFETLNMSMKIAYIHQKTNLPSIINNQNISTTNKTNSIVHSGTSYFKGIFNFKYTCNLSLNTGENTITNVNNTRFITNIDAIFNISKTLTAKITNTSYLINNQFYNTNQLDITLKPKNKNLLIGLRAQNILNEKNYNFQYVTDYLQNEVIFNALPRYAYVYASISF